ncbi:hypothetical protein, partial [Nocardia shimofusensis]|uniref:hypothetical protein n=1 Tax=Nocardia shimofusensis TaxID=228596 RepID=UPI0012EE3C08
MTVAHGTEPFQVQARDLLRRDQQPLGLATGLLDRDFPLGSFSAVKTLFHRSHVLDAQLVHPRVVLVGDLPPVPTLDLASDLFETANHILTPLLALLFSQLFQRAHRSVAQLHAQRSQESALVPALGLPDALQPLGQPLMLLLQDPRVERLSVFGALGNPAQLLLHLLA